MKLLFITNIPSPYRIEFFNELGKYVDLTVVFEAKSASGIKFNWNYQDKLNFKSIYLTDGEIKEKKINWSILKHLKKNYYDFVIATNYAYFTELFAIIFLNIRKINYFLEIDGGFIKKEYYLMHILKTYIIKNAIGYFSPSKVSDKFLIHYGAKVNNIYRYPFTSLSNSNIKNNSKNFSKEKIKNHLGLKEEFIILSIGQFIDRKGFDLIINALKHLPLDVGLCIIGDNKNSKYTSLLTEEIRNRVYFEPFKTNEELSKYYTSADVFVLASREEVWGLVINEAMSFGLPIITTNRCIAGLELVNDYENGFLIPINNISEIVKKVLVLYNSKDLIEEIQFNNIKKIQEYSIEKMVEAHLKVLHMINSSRN